ncbi:MAG: hypothetical protein IIV64_01995, partial [Muribaculaceae bacterium]|nr:hypothetical protein [Muribaculaceae bacterium]
MRFYSVPESYIIHAKKGKCRSIFFQCAIDSTLNLIIATLPEKIISIKNTFSLSNALRFVHYFNCRRKNYCSSQKNIISTVEEKNTAAVKKTLFQLSKKKI